MNVAVREGMSLAEFLAWDEGQDARWEFDGSQPVAMVGGTAAHARICRNLGYELTARLRGSPCQAFMEGLRIEVAGSLRSPDAIVVCGSTDNTSMVAENPVVVFEVLSPSAAASTDVIVKNVEYRATPSIERYVMLSQDRIATNYQRQGKDWIGMLVTEIDAVLDMPEIGIHVPLLSLYHGVFDR